MQRLRNVLLLLACLAASPVKAAEPAGEGFPLRDGDVWVMAGDSITAQHLHSNYFEAFCFARYPKQTFAFRNSGVGGHTIPSTLARFDYDIAAWKPTVVSVELGMNDQGSTPTDKYIANMATMVQRIRSINARPVMFTASPINNGNTSANLGGNKKLDDYATALKAFAAKEKLPFADQFHALLDVWGKNKPSEDLARSLPALKGLARDDRLEGVEHLRAFLKAQEKRKGPLVSMQGDAVHPGPPGQLMMAAALLRDLGADGYVSEAALDAGGKVVAAKGCTVENVKADKGRLSFDRLDECSPFPIPDDARAVLPLYPPILELSRYTLKVSGLEKGKYTLKVNGAAVATLTAAELEKGINLTAYAQGPIAAQGKAVLAAVAAKEGLVNQWRGLSRTASMPGAPADAREKLADLGKKVQEADVKIREAARPRKLHFEIAPPPKPNPAYTNPAEAGPDFAVQGEYVGAAAGEGKLAAQVVALGEGKFDVWFLTGGLPGAGWEGKGRVKVSATTTDGKTAVAGGGWVGAITAGQLTGKTPDGVAFDLKRVERHSPTAGAKPENEAVMLFDGTTAAAWAGGKLVENNLLKCGTQTKKGFAAGTLHVEFRTPFQPKDRGQGRGNSGVYVQGFEVQVLDSFGLEGKNNECGALYGRARPAVNMCYPPLSWQTFDVEIKEAGGNTVLTVRHNGVTVHDHVVLRKGPPRPASILLQNHGNPVVYRNIWFAESEPPAARTTEAPRRGKVEMKGTLKTGIAAIGGETTGIILKTKDGDFELELRTDEFRKKAEKLDGKTVTVKGTLRIQKGVEVKERKIVAVEELKESDK
jgi:lysophospholipase L1-like esterase